MQVVVTRAVPGDAVGRLRERHDVWLWEEDRPIPPDLLEEQVGSAHGLYSMLTDAVNPSLLAAAPDLVAVSQMAVGTDNIDLAACSARSIPVGHTPGVLTETTADTAMALLLAAARRIPEGAQYIRDGKWGEWAPDTLLGADLHDATVGIIGLGRIGTAVARRLGGFDTKVLYTGPNRKPVIEAELRVHYRDLTELLSEADYVVVTAPLNAATHHLLDGDAFAAMQPSAILVNVSRGPLVDTKALVDALSDGTIAAAALDVTDPEPLPADHPLMQMPNCLVIPHLGSASVRTRTAMADLAADNLLAGLDGRRMPRCANPEVYAEKETRR